MATTGHFVVVAAVAALPAAAGAAAGLRVTGTGLVWAAAMGAVTTALAYVAWYACQRTLSGTGAGVVQLAIPVLTAVGAVLVLGESLSPTLLVAAALVGAGMWTGRARCPEAPRQACTTWSRISTESIDHAGPGGAERGPTAAVAAASRDANVTTPIPRAPSSLRNQLPETNPGRDFAQATTSSRKCRSTSPLRAGSSVIITINVFMSPTMAARHAAGTSHVLGGHTSSRRP